MPAVVSNDHAGESTNVEHLARSTSGPRLISADEVRQHAGKGGEGFWAVIDMFVVDATQFVETHPGGLRKLLSADSAAAGATGCEFGFSFSRGRNAHFPGTGKKFAEGVKRFLAGKGDGEDGYLPPVEVAFAPYGSIVILGRLQN